MDTRGAEREGRIERDGKLARRGGKVNIVLRIGSRFGGFPRRRRGKDGGGRREFVIG